MGLKEAESGPAVFSENLNLEGCGGFKRREGRLVIPRLRGREVSAETRLSMGLRGAGAT